MVVEFRMVSTWLHEVEVSHFWKEPVPKLHCALQCFSPHSTNFIFFVKQSFTAPACAAAPAKNALLACNDVPHNTSEPQRFLQIAIAALSLPRRRAEELLFPELWYTIVFITLLALEP